MSLPLYEPLTKGQIRLLHLHPKLHKAAQDPTNALLHGTLQTTTLDNAPPYVALSYVWGSSTNLQPLILNNRIIQITPNLATALSHIQNPTSEVVLWIDALCIDQSNTSERSAQVLRMVTIYAAASHTLVWLGQAGEISGLIMDSFEPASRKYIEMGEQPTTIRGSAGVIERTRRMIEQNPEIVEYYKKPSFGTMVDGYRDLVTREWWYRAWVLQEFAVAREVWFQCGRKRVRLDAFEYSMTLVGPLFYGQAHNLVSTHDWLDLKDGQIQAFHKSPIASAANGIFIARHQYKGVMEGYKPRVADLLWRFNVLSILDVRLRATDPKDKVYALLGLASDFEALGIVPDYKKSVEEVYTETVTKLLKQGHVSYLQLCKYNPHSALPSWVPDLREDIPVSPNESSSTNKPFRAGHKPNWTAFPRALPSDPRVLAIEGCRIGTVKETGDVLSRTETDPVPSLAACHQFIVQIDTYLRQTASLDICPYGASSKDIDQFEPDWFEPAQYRIPVADKEESPETGNVTRATGQSEILLESLIAVIRAYYNAMDAVANGSTTGAASFAMALKSNMGQFNNYMGMLAHNAGRRPFITENGYVGVGPKDLKSGDEAVVVLGAAVPYVLRMERNGRRVLLGDAYVHGVMDGEILEGDSVVEVFELV
ncbi:HET-domain-containing protein [Lophium mytilinum]|uniref:HET-domain-containing protein n=1 Tax=Lophium mytilinum TaxID=390894 RepID=A0A6A6Q8E0_9PEZI|nr:HET-domain-containing protein [Lophium mytilinum]